MPTTITQGSAATIALLPQDTCTITTTGQALVTTNRNSDTDGAGVTTAVSASAPLTVGPFADSAVIRIYNANGTATASDVKTLIGPPVMDSAGALRSPLDGTIQSPVSGASKRIDPTAWPMRVPTVIASPPAIATGANSAASQIAGSVLFSSCEAGLFSFFGGAPSRGINYPGYLGVRLGLWVNGTSSSHSAVEFTLDTADAAGRFEIYTLGVGGDYRVLMALSDGSWGAFSQFATRTMPNDGGLYLDLVTLGAAGEYRLRIEFIAGAAFLGLRAGPTDAVRPVRNARRIIMPTDSFGEGIISDAGNYFAPADAFPQQLAYLTGYDIMTCGKGGSGYVETVPNQSYKFRNRIQEALQYSGDFLFAGGINDTTDSLAEFMSEASGCFSDVKNAGRRLWVMSPFWPNGINGYPAYLLQYRDALKTMCDQYGGTFLDVLDLGAPDFLAASSTWAGALTASVASGQSVISLDSVPAYFATANTGKDKWFVKIGSGASQCVREVQSITGSSAPYSVGLRAAVNATFAAGTPVSLAGPGYLSGTGRQNALAGDGTADRYTGPDTTHPTRLGHHNIARVVAYLMARAEAAA